MSRYDDTPRDDDCLRCCIAAILEVSPRRVRHFPPLEADYSDANAWWNQWRVYLRRRFGLALHFHFSEAQINRLYYGSRRWLAVVRADTKLSHGCAMEGPTLLLNPGSRVRAPQRRHVGYGITLEPVS